MCSHGIIIAQSAIQGDKPPCAAEAAIIPVPHGLKSKCPYGRFLFCAHGIIMNKQGDLEIWSGVII